MKKLILLAIILASCATTKTSCDAYGLNNQKNNQINLDSTKIVIIFDKV
jgi:uncharacterized lipoprotein YmbA